MRSKGPVQGNGGPAGGHHAGRDGRPDGALCPEPGVRPGRKEGEDPTDLYSTLGVTRGATPHHIKTAYRRAAAEYHPDRNPGDPQAAERFKAVTNAYEILSDPVRRKRYDETGDGGATKEQRDRENITILNNFFREVVTGLLQQDSDLDTVDLIGKMRGKIKAALDSIKNDKRATEKALKRARRMSGRFQTKHQENVLESFAREAVANLEGAMRMLVEKGERFQEVHDYLDDYVYTADPRREGRGPVVNFQTSTLNWGFA